MHPRGQASKRPGAAPPEQDDFPEEVQTDPHLAKPDLSGARTTAPAKVVVGPAAARPAAAAAKGATGLRATSKPAEPVGGPSPKASGRGTLSSGALPEEVTVAAMAPVPRSGRALAATDFDALMGEDPDLPVEDGLVITRRRPEAEASPPPPTQRSASPSTGLAVGAEGRLLLPGAVGSPSATRVPTGNARGTARAAEDGASALGARRQAPAPLEAVPTPSRSLSLPPIDGAERSESGRRKLTLPMPGEAARKSLAALETATAEVPASPILPAPARSLPDLPKGTRSTSGEAARLGEGPVRGPASGRERPVLEAPEPAASFSPLDLVEKLGAAPEAKRQRHSWRDYKELLRAIGLSALLAVGAIGYRGFAGRAGKDSQTVDPAGHPAVATAGQTPQGTPTAGAPDPAGTAPRDGPPPGTSAPGIPATPAVAPGRPTPAPFGGAGGAAAGTGAGDGTTKTKTPMVSIVSTPPGAMIEIDGTVYGKTPLIMPSPAHASHLRVKLRLDQYQSWEEIVQPNAAGHFNVNISLKPVR